MSGISDLRRYLLQHTYVTRMAAEAPNSSINIGDTHVRFHNNPNAEELVRLVNAAYYGHNNVGCNPYFGSQYSHLTLDQWLNGREMAACFMALSEHLGLGRIYTPKEAVHGLTEDLNQRAIADGKSAFVTGPELAAQITARARGEITTEPLKLFENAHAK